jgi:hypothetical protein
VAFREIEELPQVRRGRENLIDRRVKRSFDENVKLLRCWVLMPVYGPGLNREKVLSCGQVNRLGLGGPITAQVVNIGKGVSAETELHRRYTRLGLRRSIKRKRVRLRWLRKHFSWVRELNRQLRRCFFEGDGNRLSAINGYLFMGGFASIHTALAMTIISSGFPAIAFIGTVTWPFHLRPATVAAFGGSPRNAMLTPGVVPAL